MSPIEPIFELLCEMDVMLISLGLTLALLGISRHIMMQCPETIKKSSQPKITDQNKTLKIRLNPSLVQNFCFMRNHVTHRKYLKEAPDDNDSHSFLLLQSEAKPTRRKRNETKETTVRTRTRITAFYNDSRDMGTGRVQQSAS
ncbi:hypothetical protein [Fictibacillus terranigra]|uniref:Uncharacterized protein n=1 Tax=Fictibacillus terranigra TaxID=3058424 RepID=A0ABT8E7G2_9BACL|nr:hypothetical protein [Fictibacillus sp. CENA-BCM004]MDN4073835.1 hypothetical protein [Fictibacillus sp. CENA-BCM004]